MATLTVAVSSMATNRAMVFQSSASQPKHKGSLTADRLKFCLGKGTQTKFLRSNTGLLETGQLRAERAIKCRCSQVSIDVKEKVSTAKETPVLPFRVGHGFDLHRLEPGLPFIIGGINIPHDRGCEAHSDGDVLLHCVVDAILGALSLPDIGQLFPDNDPKWRGAPSSVFVKEAVKRMHLAGYELGNLDATLILQRPKLSPFKEAIRSNLSELLGADLSAINIKAKTHEKVDSLGENRSVAAHTVVLLMRKQS